MVQPLMQAEIVALYRDWILTITADTATGLKFDHSGEMFECHRQPSAEDALRAARRKVDSLEGKTKWIDN